MSSGTDFGSKSKMADFKAADFLSGNITATEVEKLKKKELNLVAKELHANLQVEDIPKADMKAVVLQALTERSMLKRTVRPADMTEMQFQSELKNLEMQEREAERQREHELQKEREERERQEREGENRESMLRENQKSRDSLR